MDSLANLAALLELDATARILYKNLEEEGFDRQEILEYIRLQIEGTTSAEYP